MSFKLRETTVVLTVKSSVSLDTGKRRITRVTKEETSVSRKRQVSHGECGRRTVGV